MSTLARLLMGAGIDTIDWDSLSPGDPVAGGFYIGTLDGYAHILAGKSAEALLAWGGASISVDAYSDVDSTANTTTLVNSAVDYPAAQYCREYRGGGFDDWDLPARYVLNLLWLNLPPGGSATPAAFKTGGAEALEVSTPYWSSTAANRDNAHLQDFSTGSAFSVSKNFPRWVRPVRRLEI